MAVKEVHAFAVSQEVVIEATSRKDQDGSGRLLWWNESCSLQSRLFSLPLMRQVVTEMHSLFIDTQHAAREGKLLNSLCISFSQKYRTVLARANNISDEATAWALFESLFFSSVDTPLVVSLIHWARQSFSSSHEVTRELIEDKRKTGKPIDGSQLYWKAIVLSLIECQFSSCSSLLLEGTPDEPRKALAKALNQLNMEWLSDEKASRFEKWQGSLKKDLNEGKFEKSPNVMFIVNIIVGEEESLTRVASSLVSNWWQLFPFIVLVNHATAQLAQIPSISGSIRSLFNHNEDGDVFDCMFSLDISRALSSLTSSIWVAVHLTDLLFHIDRKSTRDSTLELRRSILREYGSALFSQECTWHMGADYLIAAGEEGRLALENMLSVLPLSSERMAKKAMRMAEGMDLIGAIGCITGTMSLRHVKGRRWGAALSWALRDRTGRFLDTVINAIINAATGQEIALLDVLEQLGEEVLRTPSFTLLFNLYRFHRSLKEENREAALTVLVATLISPDVPSSFRERLFSYLLDFLSCDSTRLPSSSVYSLLELVKCDSLNESSPSGACTLSEIRLRLCESLAFNASPSVTKSLLSR